MIKSFQSKDDGYIKISRRYWLEKFFKPFIKEKDRIRSTFQPYSSFKELLTDVLQPFLGTYGLLRGLSKLLITPFKTLQEFRSLKSPGLTFTARSVRSLSAMMVGIWQLATTPITWLLKIPIRALLVTPIAAYWSLHKIKQAPAKTLATIDINKLQPASLLRPSSTSSQTIPNDTLWLMMKFLTVKELHTLQAVSKQFYKTSQSELSIRQEIYYAIGKRYIQIINEYNYKWRKQIYPDELIKSFAAYDEKDSIMLFEDETCAKQYALSLHHYEIITSEKQIYRIAPVIKVRYCGEKPNQSESLKLKTIAPEKSSKYFEARFFRANKDEVKPLEGQVVTDNKLYTKVCISCS